MSQPFPHHGDGTGQTGAGEGSNGQPGGQQDNQGGLLDEEANQQQQEPEGQGGQPLFTAEQTSAIQQMFQSEIDRRVNQIVGDRRRQNQPQPQQPQNQAPAGLTPQDTRDARGAYREYVAEFRFLGPEEREHASELANGLIATSLLQGLDPEEAGRQVAGQVTGQVQKLRALYESRTIAALKRKGLLPTEGQPVPNGGQTQPGSPSQYQKGADKAKAMFAHRLPVQTH